MLYVALVLLFVFVADGKVDERCGQELIKVVPCLPYVQNNVSFPSQECCIQLHTVRDEAPVCLCELVTSAGSGVNLTSLLALPRICQVDADASKCPALLEGAETSTSSQTVQPALGYISKTLVSINLVALIGFGLS